MDKNLYFSKQCRAIDKLAARSLGISSFELMQLAGLAIFSELKAYASILVITGPGNNGGDGFIIADLAKKQGIKTCVLALRSADELTGDAKLAADQFINNGGEIENNVDCAKYDCIVDAIFGTGLSKAITGNYAKTINWINQQNKPVLSVDIPSGLNSDTGSVAGTAVIADKTVTIICHKPGLYTRLGKQLCGVISLKSLSIPSECFSGFSPAARWLDKASLYDIANTRGHASN
ncbi:MAG: NAD(P)H-hydrate epimerase, partial [Proteobacteria bacterium]|nr:NAD(P)H-hydrate epimerase [Pseudomonadota bacterium]